MNLHLEAYDDGEGKEAQTAMLLQILQEERYMAGAFGEEYLRYKGRVMRYLGRRRTGTGRV